MLMRDLRLCGFFAVASLLTCLAASCLEGADIALSDCLTFFPGHLDSAGYLDPCCKDESTPCVGGKPPEGKPLAPVCDGSCLPVVTNVLWDQTPILLWHGPGSSDIPECPAEAKTAFPLGRDPISPGSCFSCECSDPSCVLPEGLIADGADGCVQGPFTPFPAEVDGSCSDKASISPNDLQSIAILPPTVSKCVGSRSSVPVPRDINIREWNTIALVCNGTGADACPDPNNQYCFAPASSNKFARCVERKTGGIEDTLCPPEYPHHHVYYEKHDVSVECTPCACSPPVGSVCTAAVTAYTNNACTDDGAIFKDFIVSRGPPPCVNVQPNTGLKGLTEAWIQNQPGKCEPSESMHTGKVAPLHTTAHEYCCADPDFPDPVF